MAGAIGVKALYLLFVWLISAATASWMSERKGYGERVGLTLGLLLSAVGLLIVLLLPGRPARSGELAAGCREGGARTEPKQLRRWCRAIPRMSGRPGWRAGRATGHRSHRGRGPGRPGHSRSRSSPGHRAGPRAASPRRRGFPPAGPRSPGSAPRLRPPVRGRWPAGERLGDGARGDQWVRILGR